MSKLSNVLIVYRRKRSTNLGLWFLQVHSIGFRECSWSRLQRDGKDHQDDDPIGGWGGLVEVWAGKVDYVDSLPLSQTGGSGVTLPTSLFWWFQCLRGSLSSAVGRGHVQLRCTMLSPIEPESLYLLSAVPGRHLNGVI